MDPSNDLPPPQSRRERREREAAEAARRASEAQQNENPLGIGSSSPAQSPRPAAPAAGPAHGAPQRPAPSTAQQAASASAPAFGASESSPAGGPGGRPLVRSAPRDTGGLQSDGGMATAPMQTVPLADRASSVAATAVAGAVPAQFTPGEEREPGGQSARGAATSAEKKQKPERQPLGPVRGTIRTFGELCITAGLILILFVVWQLWWTDIDANRDNRNLAQELTQQWDQNADRPPADPDTPFVADPVAENSAFGILYVPRWGDDYYRTIAEGISMEPVLNRMGLGRYPKSAMPGEVGNFAVAGHRVTYGKPLNLIAELQPGDQLVVQTADGFYSYTFRNYDIVLPDEVEVLAPVPGMPEYEGKDRIMTLTACNPMFSARERYIGYAELTDWSPAADGPPESIADSAAYDENRQSS